MKHLGQQREPSDISATLGQQTFGVVSAALFRDVRSRRR
jgi:hypothetical protein